MQVAFTEAIKAFEGFTAQADWDYAQYSNGYGTRAQFPGEVIDKAEADRRFRGEIGNAQAIVDAQLPNLDEGTRAAMTSLTFNAGTAWVNAGLGEALRAGDLEKARSIFQQYNKAGGQVLPGLVERRTIEASWIGATPAVASTANPIHNVGPGPTSEVGQPSGAELGKSISAATVSRFSETGTSITGATDLENGSSPLRFNRLPPSIDWQSARDFRLTLNLDYSLRNQEQDENETRSSTRDYKTYL